MIHFLHLIYFFQIWSVGAFVILFLANTAVTTLCSKKIKHQPGSLRTGINFITTNLVSIFTFNLLPEDPTAKAKGKNAAQNKEQVKKIAAVMVATGASVMMVFMVILYCVLSYTDFRTNDEIILTKDQLNHIVWIILTPLYFTVIVASAAFHYGYNNNKSSTLRFDSCANVTQGACCAAPFTLQMKFKKMILSGSILLLTAGILTSGFLSMPASPGKRDPLSPSDTLH